MENLNAKKGQNLDNTDNNLLILQSNKTFVKFEKADISYIQSLNRTIKRKGNLQICRICLSDDNDQNNPLINPCKCSGTMKYIHLKCLRHWLNSKLKTKTLNHLVVYSFKNLECEICKFQIPGKLQ